MSVSRARRVRPAARRLLVLILVAAVAAAAAFALGSCRPEPPPAGADLREGEETDVGGAGGGDGKPPEAPKVSVYRSGESVAAGPFANLRSFGWLSARLIWGWGDIEEEEGAKVFFTLDLTGSVSTVEIWGGDVIPLRDGSGCCEASCPADYRPGDFRMARFHPLDGDTVTLGRADALSLSPSGRYLLVYGPDGTVCFDTTTWSGTPQPELDTFEFPYAGIDIEWVGDTLVLRRWEPYPDTGVLRLVAIPSGEVVRDLASPGKVLVGYPSPCGLWLAVLHIRGENPIIPPEHVYPYDCGPTVRIYDVSALTSPDLEPVAVITASEAKDLTLLSWSADGTALAMTEATVLPPRSDWDDIPPPDWGRVRFSPNAVAILAEAPEFRAAPLRLDPTGSWLTAGFSPGGRYLVVRDDAAARRYSLWDRSASKTVDVDISSEIDYLSWLNDHLAVGSRPCTSEMVLIDAAAGRVSDIAREWAHESWQGSPSGELVARRTTADSPAEMDPFGELAPGEWLIIRPLLDVTTGQDSGP